MYRLSVLVVLDLWYLRSLVPQIQACHDHLHLKYYLEHALK